jgi:hypothetical protein
MSKHNLVRCSFCPNLIREKDLQTHEMRMHPRERRPRPILCGPPPSCARPLSEMQAAIKTIAPERQIKSITEEHGRMKDELTEKLTDSFSNILLGEKIPLDVVNAKTGKIIIPANRKITKTLLRKLAMVRDHIEVDPSPTRNKIREIIQSYQPKFAELDLDREHAMDRAS